MSRPEHQSEPDLDYRLDEQVGFLLRKAYQRHMMIFARKMAGNLTPTQFSTLVRLFAEPEPISQNALGRLVAMDAATTKGVISRLEKQGLLTTERDRTDKRRYLLRSTEKGRALLRDVIPIVKDITEETVQPLTKREQVVFLKLLAKLT
ncbi:MarR family winged helix-turn-helix transcriptional regulator [Fulvimarina endophytica]|nr:MarR family transcriptional regulator [Fulvimarina endophytica]